MKTEKLNDAVGKLDENSVAEAGCRKKKRPRWVAWAAAAACVAVAVAVARPLLFGGDALPSADATEPAPATQAGTARAVSLASYPESVAYPTDFTDEAYFAQYEAWEAARESYKETLTAPEDTDYFDSFYRTTAAAVLGAAEGENLVYSPSNVYMALAMLTELTDGQSRRQLLDLLGADSLATLRAQATYLWGSNYCNDGLLTTVMSNSVWLADGLTYRRDTLDRLAETYYASSFSGEMGSEAYNELLHDWLNEQTDGLLSEQAEELEFTPQTVLALASTVYFKGNWSEKFSDKKTESGVFHCASGEDVTVDFLNQRQPDTLYWGESYTAIKKSMEGGADMWLILPDEDKRVSDLLSEGEIFEMTSYGAQWEQQKRATVRLSLPQFDISSDLDLIETLKTLGVTDIFDGGVSDFSPMSDDLTGICVSQIDHAARVAVDEDGCTAAAYTVAILEKTADYERDDEIAFTLDRPFLFVITGCGEQPLFLGIVNRPTA